MLRHYISHITLLILLCPWSTNPKDYISLSDLGQIWVWIKMSHIIGYLHKARFSDDRSYRSLSLVFPYTKLHTQVLALESNESVTVAGGLLSLTMNIWRITRMTKRLLAPGFRCSAQTDNMHISIFFFCHYNIPSFIRSS